MARGDYHLKDMFQKFKKESENKKKLSRNQFFSICKEFNNEVAKLLFEKEKIRLPLVGELMIAKNNNQFKKSDKSKGKPAIDWKATKKAGKHVYHMNEHTNGWVYKFKWLYSKITGVRAYDFRAVRKHQRKLAQLLLNTNIDFYQ